MKFYLLFTTLFVFAISSLSFSQEKPDNYVKALALMEQGQYEDASILLENICKQFPDNYEYFSELGYTYLNLLRFDDAINSYAKAEEINNNCYKCYSHHARALYEKGEYVKAEEIVAKGFAISDTTAHLYMTRGLIYMVTDRGSLALKDFNNAITLDPQNEDYYILRANYYIQTAEAYSAYSDLSSAIKINPENPEYYYYRAYILTNLNVHDEALIDIEKAISLKSDYADYYNLKFTIHMNRNEYDLAEQAVIRSIEIKPNDYYAHLSLGDLYMQISNMDRFCDCYQKAIELHPGEPADSKESMVYKYDKYCKTGEMPYYFVRALGYYNENDFGKCISEAEKGIAKVGDVSILYNIKASAHLSRLEYDLALAAYNSCLANKTKLVQEVKDFYSYPVSHSDAEKVALSYIVKSDFGLAIINLIEKDYDAALIHIIKAVETAESLEGFDGLELLYITKGLIYIGKNDLKNAERNFDIAIEKNPYNGIPRVNKALVQILRAASYSPKKLAFVYEPNILCPRLILPSMKTLKDADLTLLDDAEQICNTVIESEPESPYPWIIKAKALMLKGDLNYCESAAMARELGLFNSFSELGAKCK